MDSPPVTLSPEVESGVDHLRASSGVVEAKRKGRPALHLSSSCHDVSARGSVLRSLEQLPVARTAPGLSRRRRQCANSPFATTVKALTHSSSRPAVDLVTINYSLTDELLANMLSCLLEDEDVNLPQLRLRLVNRQFCRVATPLSLATLHVWASPAAHHERLMIRAYTTRQDLRILHLNFSPAISRARSSFFPALPDSPSFTCASSRTASPPSSQANSLRSSSTFPVSRDSQSPTRTSHG